MSWNPLRRFQFRPDHTWEPPHAGWGADEWCNPSVYLHIPFVGMFAFFYGRLDRSLWWMAGGGSQDNGATWDIDWVSPDSSLLATVHMDYDLLDDPCPHTRTTEWIFANASKIESPEEGETW